jgi:hypothetical protein
MGNKSDLSPECQKFVKKLFAFFSKEKATKKSIVSFDRVYQRTSKALDVSYTSVHRIVNGKRPCKSNRPKERATILDDFDHCVIKRTIHGLYLRKIAPTVSLIHNEIKDSIKISKSKLTLTLIDLGSIKKIGDNRRVLYDYQVSIINDRCNYLRKIKSFSEAGYDIVYMNEIWVNQNHCTDYMWLPNDGYDAPNIPSGKGKHFIGLHAGTRSEGLIYGSDLVFLAKSKDGDYHQEMNSVVFLEWFENLLMPALKYHSSVVLDNASYQMLKQKIQCAQILVRKKLFSKTILHNTTFFFLLLIPKKYYMKKLNKKRPQ